MYKTLLMIFKFYFHQNYGLLGSTLCMIKHQQSVCLGFCSKQDEIPLEHSATFWDKTTTITLFRPPHKIEGKLPDYT